MRTLRQCEEVLGQAGLVAGSRVLCLYARGTIVVARGARVVPNEPGIVWAPAMEELAVGSTFFALNMGQWTLTHEKKAEHKSGYECCGVLLCPGFDVTLDHKRPSSQATKFRPIQLACSQARCCT